MHLLKNWRASFYVANKKMSYAKLCSWARPATEKFATCPEVGSRFFAFVSTVHCHSWRIGEQVFHIAFAVFIHEQISSSQKTCHRKFARMNRLETMNAWVKTQYQLLDCDISCGFPLTLLTQFALK